MNKRKPVKESEKIKESINSIDQLIGRLEKDHGTDIVLKSQVDAEIQWSSTGIYSLDWVMGKGLPKGRIIEVFGPESAGKTTLALHSIARSQKKEGKCALVDAEYSYDPTFANSLGVNTDDLLVITPDFGEQALDTVQTLVESNLMDIIVVDSVAALTPKVEIDGDMGDQQMGLQARMMSKALRKLTAVIGKTKTTLIFINQIRKKIGITFGNPETTSGGDALKFYASMRLDVRKKEFLGSKENPIGIRQRVKAIKNKCSIPFRETELLLYYKKGYDTVYDLFDCGVKFGIIQKSGAWFSFGGERLGQGEGASLSCIKSNKEWLKKLFLEVKDSFQNME